MTEIFASLKLFMELLSAAKKLWAFVQANKTEQWFQQSSKTFEELTKEGATENEKKKAISDLARLWGSA